MTQRHQSAFAVALLSMRVDIVVTLSGQEAGDCAGEGEVEPRRGVYG